MGEYPALGVNKAAAAVCAAAYFTLAVAIFINFKKTTYRLYVVGAVAAALRGVAFALRASSVADGDSTLGESIVSPFFQGAGFGITLALHLLIIGGWLLNTLERFKPAAWALLRRAMIALFPTVIVFGPILGLTAALILYRQNPPADDDVSMSARIRKAASLGLLIVASLASTCVMALSAFTLSRSAWQFSLRQHAHQTIFWLLPSSLLLVWAAGFRVAVATANPEAGRDEALFYPLQVLPELLQLMLWALPTVFARAHLSSRFEAWWLEAHPDGPLPIFGFSAKEDDLENSPASTSGAASEQGEAGGKPAGQTKGALATVV